MIRFFYQALIMCVAVVAFLPASGFAQSSDWVETLGARMRVHVEPLEPQGANVPWRAVLDVELEEGWKSYWLDPGDNGIPPQITIKDAFGKAIPSALIFQAPETLGYGIERYAGYVERFALGVLPTEHGTLPKTIDVFLGLCSDICVPFQTSFDIETPSSESAKKLSHYFVTKAFEKLPIDLGAVAGALSKDQVEIAFPDVPTGSYTLILSELDGWVFDDLTQVLDTDPSVRFKANMVKKGLSDMQPQFSLVSENRAHQFSGVLQLHPQ